MWQRSVCVLWVCVESRSCLTLQEVSNTASRTYWVQTEVCWQQNSCPRKTISKSKSNLNILISLNPTIQNHFSFWCNSNRKVRTFIWIDFVDVVASWWKWTYNCRSDFKKLNLFAPGWSEAIGKKLYRRAPSIKFLISKIMPWFCILSHLAMNNAFLSFFF